MLATYGSLSDEAFIDQLYRNVLGRGADLVGRTFWLNDMANGMSRATVLMRFSESPENVAKSGTEEPALGYFSSGLDNSWDCVGLTECGVASSPPLIAGDCLFPAGFVADAIRDQNVDEWLDRPVLAGQTFDRSAIDAMILVVQSLRDEIDFVVPVGSIFYDIDGHPYVEPSTECGWPESCAMALVGHEGQVVDRVVLHLGEFGVSGFEFLDLGP